MVKILLTVSLLLSFIGCVGTAKPKLQEVETYKVIFVYSDIQKTVTMTPDDFESLLQEFIFRRTYANQCIDINNNSN